MTAPWRPPPVGPLHLEIARALLATFRPRTDVYAERLDSKGAVVSLNTWCKKNGYPANWYVGAWKPVRKAGVFLPLTVDVVAEHVAGRRTVGFYPLHDDDTCNSVGVDFDNHRGARSVAQDPIEDLRACAMQCQRAGLHFLASISRGGKGGWLHVLPPRSTPAWVARAALHRIVRAAGVKHVDEGGTFDALFPKQDRVLRTIRKDKAGNEKAKSDIGNLFCVPINGRWLHVPEAPAVPATGDRPAVPSTAPGTHFLDTDPTDLGAQLRALTEYL